MCVSHLTQILIFCREPLLPLPPNARKNRTENPMKLIPRLTEGTLFALRLGSRALPSDGIREWHFGGPLRTRGPPLDLTTTDPIAIRPRIGGILQGRGASQ